MSLELLLTTYGYPVLFFGALLEGETVIIIASFLAHRGYFELPWVMLTAFLASLAADQFFFFLGRSRGAGFVDRRPAWRHRVSRVQDFVERHPSRAVLSFRFLYGLRTATPLVIGMSGYDARRFLIMNAIGAVLWVVVYGTGGYVFGQILETVLADVRKYEVWIVLGMAVIGGAIWAYRRRARNATPPLRDL